MASYNFDISPVKLTVAQQNDIYNSIMNEESYNQIEIKLKSKEQEIGVFIDDEPQQALLKLKCFSELLNKERLAYAEHLAELFELIGDDAFRNLGFIIKQFLHDSYSIQISIIRQMPKIIEMIKKRQTGYAELKEHILPFLSNFLGHEDTDLKREVAQIIAKLAPFLDETDRVDFVLTRLIDLAHDETNSQNRMIAAEILGQIAQIFGQTVCESYVCGELLSLGIDLNEFVREKAIEQLPNLAVALSQKYIEQKLIPFYLDKCNERIISVRCMCIRITSGICKYSSHKMKIEVLIQKYFDFLSDQNKDVRKTAYECLGEFISTIKFTQQDQEPLDILLAYYQNLLDKNINSLSKDVDLVYQCAFYFPGVLQAIGRFRWHQISQLYGFLLKYPSDKIRRSLAYSFHEVARILGPEISQVQLIPVLEMLLQDKNQETRNGIILNLSKFISIFDIEEREYVIDVITNLKKDQHKWRSRQVLCISIFPLTRCFTTDTVFFVIAPILFKFCSDPVAEVRKKAAKKVYHLIYPFKIDSQERNVIQEQIRAFSQSTRFNQRQSFCWMCYKLFYLEDFEEQFLERLLEMCKDPVSIVRLTALIMIDKFIEKEGFSKDRKYVKYLLISFKDDQCREIKNILTKYTFVVNKTPKKPLSHRSKNSGSSGGGGQAMGEIPEFDDKIEQIRKSSSKV